MLGILFLMFLVFPAEHAAAYSFTNVDYPGALWTTAFKINDSGQVVGQYADTSGTRHGFLLSAGTYTTIDCPSPYTAGSGAFGINNLGDIVGGCSAPGGINGFYGTSPGFVLSGGVMTLLPDPGSYGGASVQAYDINDAGQIVGLYTDPCLCGGHGFLYSGGIYTTLDIPGYINTQAYGINNLGQIVGLTSATFGGGDAHGFILDGGVYTIIDHPDVAAVPYNSLYEINDSGRMVGFYVDTSGVQHGYLLDSGTFTSVDHPSAQATGLTGITSQGRLTGNYADLASVGHGFVTALLSPQTKDDCKDGGWQNLVRANGTAFKNQGACVSYVNTGK